MPGLGRKEGFFFEKKKQKTFTLFRLTSVLLGWLGGWQPGVKVFWFFFFKKELFPFRLPA